MPIELASEDFSKLVSILSQHSEWQTVRGRVDFLTHVFAGSSRQHDILTQLNLDGHARGTAVQIIDRLQKFGQDEPGREALGVLINRLISYIGAGEDAQFLGHLLSRYPFQTKPVAAHAVAGWQGFEDSQDVAEKVIGENTLIHVCLLETLTELSRAVFRVSGPNCLGTGFLIGDGLAITNHHVVPNKDEAEKCSFEFNYQLDRYGKVLQTQSAKFVKNGVFYTSPMARFNALAGSLDVTILELDQIPSAAVSMRMKPIQAKADDRVMIIQHASGSYKKISMQNNFVEYADSFVVQYTTTTEAGSSGAPVIAANADVVAIHHAGGVLPEPATKRRYFRNEGVCVSAILDDLQKNVSDIYSRIS